MSLASLPAGPVRLAAPELVIKAVSDGHRIGLQLHYVNGMGARLKDVGAWWFQARRMWVLEVESPEQVVQRLEDAFSGEFVDLAPSLPMIHAAVAASSADFFAERMDVQVYPVESGGYAVSSAFDPLIVRSLKRLRARYHSHAAAWEVKAAREAVVGALEQVGIRRDYMFVHEQSVVLEDFVGGAGSEIPIKVPAAPPSFGNGAGERADTGSGFLSVIASESKRLSVDRAALAAVALEAGLRDYQTEGVFHLLSQEGACLADDMGLGKSRQTVVACFMASGAGRILIACPASLRINWEREIRAVYPTASIAMVGEDRQATLHGAKWVISNYERLGTLVKDSTLSFQVMAADEAHYLKECTAARTRNAFLLAARIPRKFAVTGTPLLSREVELHTLLRFTAHRLGLMPLAEFRKAYVGGKEKRAALAAELSSWMLRRRKTVLSELGKKHRQVQYISPSEGTAAYEAIWNDRNLQAMPKLGKLRQCLEAMKIEYVIDTIDGLSEGDKMIVFCQFMPTVEAVKQAAAAAGFRCVSLVGTDSMAKRQKAVDEFQTDADCRLFVTTVQAGGVGITLTAANYTLFTSPPWTPAMLRQAEDRAYRMGQKRDVFSLIPLVPKTIDEGVWRLLDSKTELEQDVVEASVCAEMT